ncbi:N-lysine methyltransferase KMT5A [Nibea albiflora]|uniref:N-lysine methyltransferase KMT5A n=1 Tax=Nibea albiflora TaxID=240163 RepID=A0ACB7EM46_NIBAL|nr:N-lysine methyltransferase KMT5A [Nibea albiflora]
MRSRVVVFRESDCTYSRLRYYATANVIDVICGRGVFSKDSICKGDFVVEYRGDRINDAESQRRRKLYHPSCTVFMFAFKWRGKTWCIDASRDDGSFGRLDNDDHRSPNCKMKKIEVTSITTNMVEEDSHPSPLSETQMDDATCASNTPEQMTGITTNMVEEDSHPSPLSETQMDDATCASNTPEQGLSTACVCENIGPNITFCVTCPHKGTSPQLTFHQGLSTACKGPLKKKKTPWQQTEVQAVERHMNRFITSCVVPGKSDCEKCLKAEPEALKNRDWENLKFYVYNRITAYKRKFQCK